MAQHEIRQSSVLAWIPVGVFLTNSLCAPLRYVPFVDAYIVNLLALMRHYFASRDLRLTYSLLAFGTQTLVWTYIPSYALICVVLLIWTIASWAFLFGDNAPAMMGFFFINYLFIVVPNQFLVGSERFYTVYSFFVTVISYLRFRPRSPFDGLAVLVLCLIAKMIVEEDTPVLAIVVIYALFILWTFLHNRT